MKKVLCGMFVGLMIVGLSGCPALGGGGADKDMLGTWLASPQLIDSVWAGEVRDSNNNVLGEYWVDVYDQTTMTYGEINKDTERGAMSIDLQLRFQVVYVSADGTESLRTAKTYSEGLITGEYKTKPFEAVDVKGVKIEDGTELWADRVLDVMKVKVSKLNQITIEDGNSNAEPSFTEKGQPDPAQPTLAAPVVWRGVYRVDQFGDLNIAFSDFNMGIPDLDNWGRTVFVRTDRKVAAE